MIPIKKNLHISCAIAFISLCSVASAKPGAYFGASIGSSEYDAMPTISTSKVIDNQLAGGLYTGYLWGNNSFNYGVEVNGNFYGMKKWLMSEQTFALHSYGLGASAVVRYNGPNNKPSHFYIESQAGLNVIFQTTTKTNLIANPVLPSPIQPNSVARVRPSIGFGGGYQISDQWNLGLLYFHVFGATNPAPTDPTGLVVPTSGEFNKTTSIDSVFVRLSYTFV